MISITESTAKAVSSEDDVPINVVNSTTAHTPSWMRRAMGTHRRPVRSSTAPTATRHNNTQQTASTVQVEPTCWTRTPVTALAAAAPRLKLELTHVVAALLRLADARAGAAM